MMKLKSKLIVLSILMAAATGLKAHEHRKGEFKNALRECVESLGIEKPQRGERPSDEDREKMGECLKEKGFEKPDRPFKGKHSKRDSQ